MRLRALVSIRLHPSMLGGPTFPEYPLHVLGELLKESCTRPLVLSSVYEYAKGLMHTA